MADVAKAKADLREQGWCVVPAVLTGDALRQAQDALAAAIDAMRARGLSTHTNILDPNDANVRVYNLPGWDPLFVELLRHPVARALVEAVLGTNNIVSNFTANIAFPGSRSMKIHSDQALVIPPPWNDPWAMNIIWCLDDVHEGNGATRFVPGSQHYRSFAEVPADIADRSVAFTAPAGSLIAMEGRVWHTSGANTSADERRAMMFAYYTSDFIRQQVNWEVTLPPEVKSDLDEDARRMLGMGPSGNARIGGALVTLDPAAAKPVVDAARQSD